MKEITYIEHQAGEFENGLQICIYCGEKICDYTEANYMSSDSHFIPKGWAPGKIWRTGINPVQTTSQMPKENYGGDDPYLRKIKKCTEK